MPIDIMLSALFIVGFKMQIMVLPNGVSTFHIRASSIKHNNLQKICGTCATKIIFPFKESSSFYNLIILKGYCDNNKCPQYKHWLDIEFVNRENDLDLGHKYFDNVSDVIVGKTRHGTASDAVKQVHSYSRNRKVVESKRDSNDIRIKRRKYNENRMSKIFELEDTENDSVIQDREDLKDDILAQAKKFGLIRINIF